MVMFYPVGPSIVATIIFLTSGQSVRWRTQDVNVLYPALAALDHDQAQQRCELLLVLWGNAP